MVSLVWAVLAFNFGLLGFILVPMLAGGAHVEWRLKIGRWFTDLAMKCFESLALVQRVYGGYDLIPMKINDDRKMAEVTVSSGVVTDDKKLPFKDPAGKIKRLQGKPCCELHQDIPAAISPEISEMGYWLREHGQLNKAADCDSCGGAGRAGGGPCAHCNGTGTITEIDPYIDVDDTMRVSDPKHTFALPGSSVEPGEITTAETLTKRRFAEYAGDIGAVEMGATFVSFAAGAGVVAGLVYLRQNVIDGGGGGSEPTSTVPIMLEPLVAVPQHALDAMVILL